MVEFRTKLDEKAIQSLAKFQLKKSIWIIAAICVIAVLAGILFIVFANGFFDENGLLSDDVLLGIILIAFGLIFFPVYLFAIKRSQKSVNSSMSVLSNETVSIFTFDENEITVSQKKGDSYEAFTRAGYDYIYRVVETEENYFLYISKAQCHVIDKSSLTQGTLTEFNAYLINNLSFKFKPMKNNKKFH